MALQQTKTLTCPQCGKKLTYVIWNIIDTADNQDLVQKLMERTLFDLTCPCGQKFSLVYPLLYHDPDRKLLLYLLPLGTEHPEKHLEEMHILSERLGSPYTARIVATPETLREKIDIAAAGRDDCLMELTKFFLIESLHMRRPKLQLEQVLYLKTEKQETVLLIDRKGKVEHVPFPRELYHQLGNVFDGYIGPDLIAPFAIIDQNWAHETADLFLHSML